MSMIDRTNGSRVGYAGTSIPNQAIEYKSYGYGTVREYTLSPEELEEVRQKYPATKRDKAFKKPVVHNPRKYLKQEEEQDMTGQRMSKEGPSCGLTKQVFLEQIAAGETVPSIEKAWGMKYNTLSFWVKKWDCRGMTAEKAKDLLAAGTPKETQLLREKETLPAVSHSSEVDLLVAAKKEIAEVRAELQVVKDDFLTIVQERDQLTTELAEVKQMFDKAYQRNVNGNAKIGEHLQAIQELKTEVEHWKGQATEVVALAGKANDTLSERLSNTEMERDVLQAELNRMITEADGLYRRMVEAQEEATKAIEELDKLREATGEVPEPASETQLLDRSIAELTRAKWILNRLTASGE